MNLILNKKIVLISTLVLVALAVTSLVVLGIKWGKDFQTYQLTEVVFEDATFFNDFSSANLSGDIAEIQLINENTMWVYSTSGVEVSAPEGSNPSISNFTAYPAEIEAIAERVSRVAVVSLVAYILFTMFILKNKGLTRADIKSIVGSEVLIILLILLISTGGWVIVSQYMVALNRWFISIELLIVGILMTFTTISNLYLVSYLKQVKLESMNNMYAKFIAKNFKGMLITLLGTSLVMLFSFLFLGYPVAFSVGIILIVFVLYSWYLFVLQGEVLRAIYKLASKFPSFTTTKW